MRRLAALGLMLLPFSLLSCVGGHTSSKVETPLRANPAYTHWLQQQSLLTQANPYIALISGTEVGWSAARRVPIPGTLLGEASVWLEVQPFTLVPRQNRSILAELAEPDTLNTLQQLGVEGLYLGTSGSSGKLWTDSMQTRMAPDGDTLPPLGQDSTSLNFADHIGKDSDYELLSARLAEHKMQTGGSLLPLAVGMGPDFFLAARAFQEYTGIPYAGLFCMMRVPRELWTELPAVEKDSPEWRGLPLDAAQMTQLQARGILPRDLAQDRILHTGWAATPPIRGTEGSAQRWLYRFYEHPQRVTLNWSDPSALAKRLLSASAIRQTGVLRQALVGVSVAPLNGLVSYVPDRPDDNAQPARDALRQITAEVHRYGGWAILTDALSLRELTPYIQARGADFYNAGYYSAALHYALLTGDASALRAAVDASLAARIPLQYLAHGLQSTLRMEMLPGTLEERTAYAQKLMNLPMRGQWGKSDVNALLNASPATMAALALGMAPQKTYSYEEKAQIQQAHSLMIACKAMQPGMFFLSGAELAGILELPATVAEKSGAWSLGEVSGMPITPQGLAIGVRAYETPVLQAVQKNSLLQSVRHWTDLRRLTGVDQGRMQQRLATAEAASFAVMISLPEEINDEGRAAVKFFDQYATPLPGSTKGKMLAWPTQQIVFVANFSSSPVSEVINLPKGVCTSDGRLMLRYTLPPQQSAVFLLHSPTPMTQE